MFTCISTTNKDDRTIAVCGYVCISTNMFVLSDLRWQTIGCLSSTTDFLGNCSRVFTVFWFVLGIVLPDPSLGIFLVLPNPSLYQTIHFSGFTVSPVPWESKSSASDTLKTRYGLLHELRRDSHLISQSGASKVRSDQRCSPRIFRCRNLMLKSRNPQS